VPRAKNLAIFILTESLAGRAANLIEICKEASPNRFSTPKAFTPPQVEVSVAGAEGANVNIPKELTSLSV